MTAFDPLDADARQRFIARARLEAPGIDVPGEALLHYALERVAAGEVPGVVLAELHAGDLAVACAASHGDPKAVAQLEAWCAAAAQTCPTARGLEDELRQALLVDLLLPRDGELRLERYRGRGRLLGWLRAVAHTTALNLRRARREWSELPEADLLESLEARIDFQTPELLGLQQQSRAGFKRAFHQALSSLPPRELNVLRLRCLEGATEAQVAAFYKVTRVTVARWLHDIRARLALRTRRELTLRMHPASVDSLLRTLNGQLDVSLERFFDEHPPR